MKDVVAYVTACHGYSERRACSVTRQHRSTQRKPMTRDPRLAVRQRMQEIARTRIRYGYRRVQILLRREGWTVGRNLIYRLCAATIRVVCALPLLNCSPVLGSPTHESDGRRRSRMHPH
jgi:transposase InsO family protein